MAECNVSIDQEKLPGVKEVCRDFAVLEDHCLAYNLQEQEIESHLASNVHKSRLVQQDLQVAKKLQEEEDEIAKVVIKKQHVAIERQDNEMAQEIQDQLVRQAEQQRRQQEEKDAAIARKLYEKEMKEERRRQKHLDEEYYENPEAVRQPLDLDKPTRHTSSSPGPHDLYSPVNSQRDYSPDSSLVESKRSRNPKQDPTALHSRSRHGDRYPNYEPAETRRPRDVKAEDTDRAVRRKERPAHSPQSPKERDKGWDRDRDRRPDRESGREVGHDYHLRKHQRSDREQDRRMARGGKDGEHSRDRGHSEDGYEVIEKHTHRGKDGQQARAKSRETVRDNISELRGGRVSREEEEDDTERARMARGRQWVQSGPDEVFEEHRNNEKRGGRRDLWESSRSRTPTNNETGQIVHKESGAVVEAEYGLGEATRDLTKMDLRVQELKDLEVAKRMQEEEVKASKSHVRAAQVAQDEEMARLLMEQEKKEYRKHREREKERERGREEKVREKDRERSTMEKMALEKRRPEGDHRSNSDDVVRPRTREDHDQQRHRNHHKPTKPSHPRPHEYENVNPGYGYADHGAPQRVSARPEAAYKGAYYKR
ncbi:coiled-coil domain-containing protein 50 isoform X2 [Syngnathoides biaculeatus]|uniref:coiled-coil domain-containing protein 50 isoform X2 n=1 Tax=Syngnathoides biaculeatus TaxID=300417 RepID=UPI002ADE2787|nr:coiled-coil domain-containing protein 50 isoform X2 [Syngnathoides biaculeatus]